MMVGVNPVSDALGRVNKLEVIPLEELGRPRIDVVVNCSGVFRDLFVNQMNLLDRAIKMAAEQDESEDMNFVRKHAREQVRSSPLQPCSKCRGECQTPMFCSHLGCPPAKSFAQSPTCSKQIVTLSCALKHMVPQRPVRTGDAWCASRRDACLHSAHRRRPLNAG